MMEFAIVAMAVTNGKVVKLLIRFQKLFKRNFIGIKPHAKIFAEKRLVKDACRYFIS